jgi:hypothetical protein
MMRHTLLIERLNAKIGQDNEARHQRLNCSIVCLLVACVSFSLSTNLWPEMKGLLLFLMIGSVVYCMYCFCRVVLCAALIDERMIDDVIDKSTIALLMAPDVCNEQERAAIDSLNSSSSHDLKYRCLFEMDEKTISAITKI